MFFLCTQNVLIPVVLIILSYNDSVQSKLKQVHILFRHGERSPTETYKNDPYINHSWPGGWGQLTNEGKNEMYLLGQKFRQQYKTFLPKYYYPLDVKVLSSYADRCHMSAQLVLAGLYPPKDQQIWNTNLLWQPIPVASSARSIDNMIAMKRTCKTYDTKYKELLQSKEIKDLNTEHLELYEYLSVHTGSNIKDAAAVETLYNTLEIEQLNNLTLPNWTKGYFPEQMEFLASKNLALYTNDDFMKRMKGGVFLNFVIDSMKNKTNYDQDRALYLYAGHDLTIVSILRTMGLVNLHKPKFGASLMLELHENNSLYEVKIFYKDGVYNSPVESNLVVCEKPCLLEQFEKALFRFLPLDWEEECNNV